MKTIDFTVAAISRDEAARLVVAHHYMHRVPPMTHAYGLLSGEAVVGVVTFGTPASRHMMLGAYPSRPDLVVELNRLWVSDDCPRNSESFFLARAFKMLPPLIVLSYADTAAGHQGIVYRAAGFHYAGWTDMDRKTPRFDYVPHQSEPCETLFGTEPGRVKHSRDAYRSGFQEKRRRAPKVKYWRASGNRRDRFALEAACQWPKLSWIEAPPPGADLKAAVDGQRTRTGEKNDGRRTRAGHAEASQAPRARL